MKYDAVIFDLFGTLVYNFPRPENDGALRRMASVLSAPPNDFVRLWSEAFTERMRGVFKSSQACIGHICHQLEVPVQYDQIELAASIRFTMTKQEVTTPRTDAVEVLSSLKSKGYKTGLISNCSAETTTIWEETPLAPFIDVTVFSCSEGLMKPDPHIYQIATERLAVEPGDCLYIADGMDQELTSALQLGMHPVLIRVPGEDSYDPYREDWDGPVISSLKDVLTLCHLRSDMEGEK